MRISRRQVLEGALATAGAYGMPGLGRLAFAADGTERGLLVIVHIRGGCDGLNFISPATDRTFIEARNSDLRVSADGPDAGHALAHGPDSRIDFRLHPSAVGLAELYKDGHLAFVHAAGLTDATRSHFVATDMIERGVAGGAALARSNSGWLARYQQLIGATAPGTGICAAGGMSGDFLGSSGGLAVPDLGGGFGAPGGPPVGAALDRLYRGAPGAAGAAGRAALGAMTLIDGRIPRDAQNHPVAYAPEQGVVYEPGGDLGRALKTIAQIAKMEIGLQVATADIGGWDTHENQPGRFKNCVERLSAGIAAFYADMARYQDRLVIVTVSEFGRRLRSNKSNGTDHGRAGVMTVLGGKVRGGRFYGRWPGLGPDKLDEGVDLAVATDYRRVLGEVLTVHAARPLPLAGVFPDYADPGPLGFLVTPAPAGAATGRPALPPIPKSSQRG
jgi:uncharacterized protein (DUF1501 family)